MDYRWKAHRQLNKTAMLYTMITIRPLSNVAVELRGANRTHLFSRRPGRQEASATDTEYVCTSHRGVTTITEPPFSVY
jgi:hypothetical protein